MEVEVRRSTYAEVNRLFGRAIKRERLSSRETKNTDWFLLDLDGEPVGCGGVIWIRHDVARLKTDFILPEWRGQKLYSTLVDERVKWAKTHGARRVQINTRRPDFFARKGWTQIEGRAANHMEVILDGT